MYFFNEKQKKIKDLIGKFGYLSLKQIETLTGFKNVLEIMQPMLKMQHKNGFIFDKNIFKLTCVKNIDIDNLRAINVYIHICKRFNIPMCENIFEASIPFKLSFIKDKNIYDIAVINCDQENILINLIERSKSERVILVINTDSQIKEIEKFLHTGSNKKYIFCKNNDKLENI